MVSDVTELFRGYGALEGWTPEVKDGLLDSVDPDRPRRRENRDLAEKLRRLGNDDWVGVINGEVPALRAGRVAKSLVIL